MPSLRRQIIMMCCSKTTACGFSTRGSASGGQTPVHAHEWPAALYVLSWSDFLRRDEHGTVLADSRDRTAPVAGAGLWIDPLPPHSVENIGSAELHIIAVEVKSS